MPVAIVPVLESEKALLWEKFQDYAQELTRYGTHERVDGVFEYPYFDLYWREPDRHPFWAVVDGRRVAFALVHRLNGVTEMAEFYSFPDNRRTGTALLFAQAILERFPGPWELTQYRTNEAAVAFWRRVIGERPYTEDSYIGGSGIARLRQTFTVG
ncbi:MAG: GNAT family N-acetyltransferase [Rhizomicrobium sp.]